MRRSWLRCLRMLRGRSSRRRRSLPSKHGGRSVGSTTIFPQELAYSRVSPQIKDQKDVWKKDFDEREKPLTEALLKQRQEHKDRLIPE